MSLRILISNHKIKGRKALEALQEFYRTLDKKMLFPEQDASLNLVVRYKKTQVDRIGSYKKFMYAYLKFIRIFLSYLF
jgi:hypothetical protein